MPDAVWQTLVTAAIVLYLGGGLTVALDDHDQDRLPDDLSPYSLSPQQGFGCGWILAGALALLAALAVWLVTHVRVI